MEDIVELIGSIFKMEGAGGGICPPSSLSHKVIFRKED